MSGTGRKSRAIPSASSRPHPPSRERRGGLSPEDAALWARVAESMDARLPDKPSPEDFRRLVEEVLHSESQKGEQAKGRQASPLARHRRNLKGAATGTPAQASASGAKAAVRLPVARPVPKPPAPPSPPPEGTLDRRTRQRMMRGQVEIEARLDLHGYGLEAAHERLRQFIVACRARGLRTVLVITGKGAAPFTRHTLHGRDHWHAPERKGQLRRMLPRWLAEPALADHVAGFQPAHPRHGGGGAFYIRLRRRDR